MMSLVPLRRRKRRRWCSSKWMKVAVCKEKERALEFLMKMSLVVFEFFLQRPKDVVFEGLSEERLVMEVENREEGGE